MAARECGARRGDRISDLPDCLLVSILSLLPIQDAARAAALSSRWRRLFPATLLHFNACNDRAHDGEWLVGAVTSILAAHPPPPVRSFYANDLVFPADHRGIVGWLQDLATRGIQELTLGFRDRSHRLPASVFACTDLTLLRVTNCTIPAATAAASSHDSLTDIELLYVDLSEESLHRLLAQCTALNSLTLDGLHGVRRIHVRSPSLKKLVCDFWGLDELFIEDAPSLERVRRDILTLRDVHVKVTHAPKLEFLGYLGMTGRSLDISDNVFTVGRFEVKGSMRSLKTLAIEVDFSSKGHVHWFMQLLRLFPCLETLFIRPHLVSLPDGYRRRPALGSGSWDVMSSVDCVENHLEKVVFEEYGGQECQRELAKFLHMKGRALKTMEFHYTNDFNDFDEDWIQEQQQLLCRTAGPPERLDSSFSWACCP